LKDFQIFKSGRIDFYVESNSTVETAEMVFEIKGNKYRLIGSYGFDEPLARGIRIQAIKNY
jgi:mRNA-degrading endonuclease HigB of HigAB toxin-antitoxin module